MVAPDKQINNSFGEGFLFLFLTYGLLVPWPGIESMPPAVEAQSLNHWTTREVHSYQF